MKRCWDTHPTHSTPRNVAQLIWLTLQTTCVKKAEPDWQERLKEHGPLPSLLQQITRYVIGVSGKRAAATAAFWRSAKACSSNSAMISWNS